MEEQWSPTLKTKKREEGGSVKSLHLAEHRDEEWSYW